MNVQQCSLCHLEVRYLTPQTHHSNCAMNSRKSYGKIIVSCITEHFAYLYTSYISVQDTLYMSYIHKWYTYISHTYITNLKYHGWQQSRVEVFTWPWYLQGSGGSDHEGGERGPDLDLGWLSGDMTWSLTLNIGLLLCPVCLFALPGSACFFFQVSGWRGWVCLDVFDNFFQIIHGLEWLWRLDHPWKAMEADNHIRLWHVTGRLWLKTGNRLDVCTPYNCMSFVRFVRFHYTCDTCSSQKVFICVLPSS